MQRSDAGQRPQRIMGRDADARGLRRRGDLARLGEAAGMGDIGLGDMHGVEAEQRLELAAADEPLARGDRDRRALGHGLHQLRIARRHRLLDEERPARRQGTDVVEGGGGRGRAAVEIHHDLDLLAHGLAQRLHQLGDMIDAAQRRRVMRIGNEHDLEGAVALVDDLEGLVDQRLGLHGLIDGAHVAEAEMGIDRHAIAGLAAEEPPDRHAQILAQDVPERHLDAGDGRGADDPHAPEAMLVHHAIGLLDVAGIAADEKRRQILHRARRRRASSIRGWPRPSRRAPPGRSRP